MDETGKIYRDKYRDKTVTMTATADDGTNKASKSFDFTVLSEQAEIFYSENFGYDVPNGTLLTDFAPHASASDGKTLTAGSPEGWSFSSVGEAHMKSFMFSDENKNARFASYFRKSYVNINGKSWYIATIKETLMPVLKTLNRLEPNYVELREVKEYQYSIAW